MPERFRELKLLSLFGLAFFFLLSYRQALTNLGVAKAPGGVPHLQALTWLGRWKMFTDLRNHHTDFVAEAETPAGYTKIDMAKRYVMHWDEGPGYQRDDFYADPGRLAELARDLCRDGGASSIRFTKVTWDKTRGQVAQPRTNESSEVLGSFPCR
jgi:hypothetical protein